MLDITSDQLIVVVSPHSRRTVYDVYDFLESCRNVSRYDVLKMIERGESLSLFFALCSRNACHTLKIRSQYLHTSFCGIYGVKDLLIQGICLSLFSNYVLTPFKRNRIW